MVRIANQRQNKYGSKKVAIDNIIFASALEARRYQQLKLLLASGAIAHLELQPIFELQPGFKDYTGKKYQSIKYRADFKYIEAGEKIVEEVKGCETDMWKLKKKMFLYHYPHLELRVLTKEDIG